MFMTLKTVANAFIVQVQLLLGGQSAAQTQMSFFTVDKLSMLCLFIFLLTVTCDYYLINGIFLFCVSLGC